MGNQLLKKVLVGVTGGIAGYKVCEVVSRLAQSDVAVQVVLTQSATAFVSPLTFATLARSPAFTDADFWRAENSRPLHITLGEWADLFLIAPLSANTLGKLRYGLADNLLLNTFLACECPVLLAPAMNSSMWHKEAVQENWQNLLENERFHGIPPTAGRLACDVVGVGRMAEPQTILRWIESLLWTKGKRDLRGKRVLVSAGGTREFMDAVRFIGNPATGKQGIAIAESALHRGAEVTLVIANPSDPIDLPITIHQVTSARELERVMHCEFPHADITVMNSAVADVRPQNCTPRKLAKSELDLRLELEYVPDIVQGLSQQKRADQLLVGFAVQTGTMLEVEQRAREKLHAKGLDAIAANQTNFGSTHNQAIFIDQCRRCLTPPCTKLELAHRLWDFLLYPSNSENSG
jgi:phosphopantothenoylcysteine decarboxylase/phosphopantothenate--cysteine ligase